MNIRTIIMAIMCCAVSMAYAQTQVFVSSSGNDSNNGQTWGTAKQTIAAGIAAAGNNGTVYVKAGSYSVGSQLNIPAGVSVKGGYRLTLSGTDTAGRELPGTNSRWENAAVCTILTGGGSNRIAVVNGLLEGCVMRRGVTTGQGGGVLIDGGMVRYCVIRECDAIQESARTAEGGGAYIRNNGVLTNCVITECRGDNGPAVAGGPGSLVNNTITRNWPTHCGKVADYDGNVYNTVVIGQQCWTHENLRTTHYNDGTAIPLGNNQPTSSTSPYYYINYNALTATNLVNYGYLYNWPAVMHGAPSSNDNPSGVTGICPQGWHVPSDAEWTELTSFVNGISRYRCSGYDGQIAKALASRSGWSSSSTGCYVGNSQENNNVTGYASYPAGYRTDNYYAFSTNASFWSTRENSSTSGWNRYMNYDDNRMIRNTGTKSNAYSVRCVKQLDELSVVHTTEATRNTSTQAMAKGFCQDAGSEITNYGFCWSTSHNPTIEDNHIQGVGVAQFSAIISGLSGEVTYYVRAYAVNHAGVSYGEERTIMSGGCGVTTLTDYDGNQYNTVQIGSQCWMKENLRVTHYTDGAGIALGNSISPTVALRYYPNNDSTIVQEYGYLYKWIASTNMSSYSMPESGEVTLTVNSLMMIYDNGGPDGNYANSRNATVVLVPAVEGARLTIAGDYNTENCCDHIYVYDGIGTSQQIGSYQGSGSLNVTSQSGPLTLRFTSDGSVTNSGFSLAVSSSIQSIQKLCPAGWHIPSDAEWTQLTDYLSDHHVNLCGGNTENIAKSIASNSGWNSSSVECAVGNAPSDNNLLDFGILPAGAYNGEYWKYGEGAYYWSSTLSGTTAWRRKLTYDSPTVIRDTQNPSEGYSVRCLRDE